MVRLLGVVVGGHHRGDPSPCIVTEYMQHGDLKQYLQRHRAQECTTLARGSSVASLAGASTLRLVNCFICSPNYCPVHGLSGTFV